MSQNKDWLTTDRPDLVFENTAVGRMKKEIWDADEAQLDAILAEYGVPAPGGCEWAKPGSYIQTTVRHDLELQRKKNDVVIIRWAPRNCTETTRCRPWIRSSSASLPRACGATPPNGALRLRWRCHRGCMA